MSVRGVRNFDVALLVKGIDRILVLLRGAEGKSRRCFQVATAIIFFVGFARSAFVSRHPVADANGR